MNSYLKKKLYKNVRYSRFQNITILKFYSSKGLSNDDGTYDSDSANPDQENVSEMFVRRLKHHLSQIHSFFEKFKHGYISIGSLLLGNPDSSYDDFGLRKVIIALTSHGSLYGLDSKSGKVIWQKMTSCELDSDSEIAHLMLQRGGTHFGLEPILTIVCNVKPSGGQIIKLNPLNGKIHPEPRVIKQKITRAILLHHASQDDHVRPILVLTEGHGHDLEPKDAGKFLKDISGKMFVASIDADNHGIHGHQVIINNDNNLEMIPVWSFSR